MENMDAIVQNLFGFAAALIGAIVGGLFTLKATDKAIRVENEKENRQDEKEIQNLLDALGVEIKTLWDFHMKRIGVMIEELPDGKPLDFYYPLTQDYFTIYNSNAALIGRIKDAELREAIVVCYNKCKKVVDGFKYNNELIREFNDLNSPDTPYNLAGRLENKRNEFIAYASTIKEDHYELKGYVEILLRLIAANQKI